MNTQRFDSCGIITDEVELNVSAVGNIPTSLFRLPCRGCTSVGEVIRKYEKVPVVSGPRQFRFVMFDRGVDLMNHRVPEFFRAHGLRTTCPEEQEAVRGADRARLHGVFRVYRDRLVHYRWMHNNMHPTAVTCPCLRFRVAVGTRGGQTIHCFPVHHHSVDGMNDQYHLNRADFGQKQVHAGHIFPVIEALA